ncbi:MAG: transketolase [Lachnospiraceae bacterium]|nr:transketolase [Lachnospiraceae bacterium]
MMIKNDEQKIRELRKQIFITGYKGGLAHVASCYSCLELLYVLYLKGILRYDAKNPDRKDRDRFVLSKGHAGLALYSIMAEAGFLSEEELKTYLQPGTHIGGEPCMRDLKGVEASTGSLGHGLSMAVGMAMAQKADKNGAKTYVILGDGECEEGTVWEAAMSAPVFKLDNLVVILDYNRIQKMDFVDKIIGSDNWKKRWEAFGWSVDEVDGHDIVAIGQALKMPNETDKPRLLIAHTVKGKGVSIMENNPNWHFKLPGRKELKVFKEELEISDSELE